jgi:phage tail sheath protein FI
MPAALSYPGIYVEEIKSSVRTITGVATSIAAFVGRTDRGEVENPTPVFSFGEFESQFGGLSPDMTLGYAVRDFFVNGGSQALVVRLTNTHPPAAPGPAAAVGPAAPPAVPPAEAAVITLGAGAGKSLILEASSPGEWGNNVYVAIDYATRDKTSTTLFNLTALEQVNGVVKAREVFLNLSVDPKDPRYVTNVLSQQSSLVRVQAKQVGLLPRPDEVGPSNPKSKDPVKGTSGAGGADLAESDFLGSVGETFEADKKGLYALSKADLFNLLCIPPLTSGSTLSTTLTTAAVQLCEARRALMIVDSPDGWNSTGAAVKAAQDLSASVGTRSSNAAIFFPRLRMPDPLRENQIREFVACGAVAGVYARTDAQRGVWKAPAGIDANLVGVSQLTVPLNDGENGLLNPLGVNCLRPFPVIGRVVWGARTMAGADVLADDYKYVPVRRLALYIEESLYRGTKWIVFEPNDEPLWSQIRLNIGAFMHSLFRQGAFQGSTPKDAYFVKCDGESTTQNDINLGIVNIIVGFAPLKPAEFVVLKLQQISAPLTV